MVWRKMSKVARKIPTATKWGLQLQTLIKINKNEEKKFSNARYEAIERDSLKQGSREFHRAISSERKKVENMTDSY